MTDNLIESIRAAVAEGATAEARAAGAVACRTLIAALDAKPGEPLTPETPAPSPPTSPIAVAASALRGLPPEQLIELLIAKLRTMVPTDAQPAVRRINIPLARVPMP